MPVIKQTWKAHKAKWIDCKRCELCKVRKRVVLFRGEYLPCDILFVGEAPGESEDTLGVPFIGPAGKLLDSIIENSIPNGVKLGFTNVIGCIPKMDGRKVSDPPKYAIKNCNTRLDEIIALSKPELIVAVGTIAKKELDRKNYKYCEITHPAVIMRANIAQQPLAIQRCEIVLSNAWDAYIPFW